MNLAQPDLTFLCARAPEHAVSRPVRGVLCLVPCHRLGAPLVVSALDAHLLTVCAFSCFCTPPVALGATPPYMAQGRLSAVPRRKKKTSERVS